ncbi:MAG: hypothetical protein A2Z21_06295 [Candidatus Fraserbacteria bacterium RBG_16_55_9]|uniref:Calcineurin-like phosphoesterase domain-containing protein n=1 Tax=Fraserbacteria sp. (strain RBG_16_55_9) TaxID=1817864 RepID=A0A1F5UZV9_FRAXR|nr:MAG: hypothetical protein A2Z21_06295 [Candidatus Fraserbacteria bacterium RBG_16_55_9]
MKIIRRRFLQVGGAVLAATLTGGTAYGYQSNILNAETDSRSVWGLAQPLRLGVMSDFHAPNYRFAASQLIEEVNRAQCDLLTIVGDSVDQGGNEPLVKDLFAPMNASLGKFAVLGNWEYQRGVNRRILKRAYRDAGVQLLVNEDAIVTASGTDLRIVGLDDLLEGNSNLDLLQEKPELPTLVLSHCPALAEEIAPRVSRSALILSGHTHGGQVAPFGIALYVPTGSGPFVKGWYKVGQSDLYVSPGLGNNHVPFRIGIRPTLTILDIA